MRLNLMLSVSLLAIGTAACFQVVAEDRGSSDSRGSGKPDDKSAAAIPGCALSATGGECCDATGGGCCNALVNAGPPVYAQRVTASAPPATGGVIHDGTYVLIGRTVYNSSKPSAGDDYVQT